MKKVVILRGISGSGKSSYVAEHYPDSIVCSADDFFRVNGEYQFDASKIGEAHSACMSGFLATLVRGSEKPVVVDNTNVHVWEFENYINIAVTLGYEVEVVKR